MPLSAPQVTTNPRPCWGIYIMVDDVDATAQQVVAMGTTVRAPPRDIQDPQGTVLSIITYGEQNAV